MRMRKKKHLDEKIALCDNLIEMPPVDADYREILKTKAYIDTKAYFGNDNPIRLEIGCGKGQFTAEIASRNPDINFIAVEVNRNVICDACRKASERGLSNILFVRCGAELLLKYLPEHSVELIYLNFSCPFPKKAYENRRLTNLSFLEIYKKLMREGAEIHQKTDNMHFFEYSLEQYSLGGFRLKNVSLDLHNSGFEDNIMTEYEAKFTALGQPIYRLEAYLDSEE